jgi:hypothetical protein
MSQENNYSVCLFEKDQGNVETVCAIDIVLPKKPAKRNILFATKTKRSQKWDRLNLPEGFDWDAPEDEYTPEELEFIDSDMDRRLNGVWLMIDGTPTYITGLHYYYLQWCKIDVGYPDYRDRDRRFFLFWEACVVDMKCSGMIMVKHRREGATFKGAAIVLEYITRTFRANAGLLSKTGPDAKEFFSKLVKMFRTLPKFYQPMIAGTDNPKTMLEFDKPGERMTKRTQRVQKSEALGSKIEWKNTAENSFDSYKLKRFVCDEGGKWEEADVSKNYLVVKPTLSDREPGKAFYPSTVNEMTRKGGKNFKRIWDQSDQDNRDANNKTISGLYRYFTPAYDGLEDGADIFIDIYGRSIIDDPPEPVMGIHGQMVTIGSKTYLGRIRKSLENDTYALAEHKRQFPWTIEEAFMVEADNCSFDVERLYSQKDWNVEYAGRLLTRGNFGWTNGFGSEVRFTPTKFGRWLVAWVPDKEDQNKVIARDTRIWPGNMDLTVSGADPYDHSTTTDGRRSNGASYVFRMYNPLDPDNTYMFVCEYIYRPSTVFLFYEDMLMQSIFYGCQMLCENNKIGLINWFTEKNYGRYLMNRPEFTHTSSSRNQKTPGIPTSGEPVRDSMINMLEAYVVDAVGVEGKLYFNRLVDDLLVFDANDWQKYDATVAAGMTLLATKKNVKKPRDVDPNLVLARKYKQTGNVSQLIRNEKN